MRVVVNENQFRDWKRKFDNLSDTLSDSNLVPNATQYGCAIACYNH